MMLFVCWLKFTSPQALCVCVCEGELSWYRMHLSSQRPCLF